MPTNDPSPAVEALAQVAALHPEAYHMLNIAWRACRDSVQPRNRIEAPRLKQVIESADALAAVVKES